MGKVSWRLSSGLDRVWPAVAKIAADLALEGRTSVTDLTDLGPSGFDPEGRSRIAPDPTALPFPYVHTGRPFPAGLKLELPT